MLKIKDNVDLNELMKKYKFGKCQYFYEMWELYLLGVRIDMNTREITTLPNYDLDLIYDLIKADLVEKVGE